MVVKAQEVEQAATMLHVYYASETGTAASVAEEIRALLAPELQPARKCLVHCVSTLTLHDLRSIASSVFIIATAGDGDPPRTFLNLWKQLLRAGLPSDTLANCRIAILGLGDSAYRRFNAVARRFRARISDLGATQLAPTVLADDSDDLGADAAIARFVDTLALALDITPQRLAHLRSAKLEPRATLRLVHPSKSQSSPIIASTCPDNLNNIDVENTDTQESLTANTESDTSPIANPASSAVCNRQKLPLSASKSSPVDSWAPGECARSGGWVDSTVLVNQLLTNPEFLEDDREVRRVVFGVDQHIEMKYENGLLRAPYPGDVIELRPRNRASAVEAFCSLTSLEPTMMVYLTGGAAEHFGISLPCRLDSLVAAYPDLGGRVRRRFLHRLAAYATEQREQERLIELAGLDAADEFAAYSVSDMRTPLMVLRDFPSARPPLDHLLDMLPPLRPRAFSIAGSKSGGPEICAAIARFVTPLRFARIGVASATLQRSEIGSTIPIRVLPGPRPQTDHPLILIAAGAGAAFVRPIAHACSAPVLLFYGCRCEKGDFLYADEWRDMVAANEFELFTAFSRETSEKVYVQDRIREQKIKVWTWIDVRKSSIYISGKAGAFAREVRRAIVDVVAEAGSRSEDRAERYVRIMEKKRRLLFECW